LGPATLLLAGPLLATGCATGEAEILGVLNERDRPMFLELRTDRVDEVEVPARSWGRLALPAIDRGAGWRIRVIDGGGCRLVATVGIRSRAITIHIDGAGTVSALDAETTTVPTGMRLVDPLPAGRCHRAQAP
jgi:hypothetical protein